MKLLDNLRRYGVRAFGLGVVNALLLSAVMVPAFLSGISPFPEPPSLAFAETLLGTRLPLPIGLVFHVAYVTLWSVVFVVTAYPALTFLRALGLGFALWLVLILVFFPFVGWGLLGLAVGPKLIVASLIPHLLFSVFLWGLGRVMFANRALEGTPQ